VRVLFLGTGTSHGVPMIGCGCATCRSDDPRDRRWRPSVLITLDDLTQVLVDTATDLRAQALAFGVTRVDAILFTHSHADHILGLDEVRRFNVMQGCAVSCYADARTREDIRATFRYMFDPATPKGGGVPRIDLHPIDGPFELAGQVIQPVPVLHGTRTILGFRVGRFAYLTDCSRIPDESWPLVTDLDTLVLDALRHRPHPTHFTVAEAVAVAERIGARRTFFTHICHDLPHEATCASLPAGMALAYDGLELTIA
jgi:phosphoribosyl 1,2-cyclic phosphate phosphodiesterase